METKKKELFLTFDDGPVPGPTDWVVDELSKSAATATFFCTGDNIRKHPAVFARIFSEGHAVGNHTVNHLDGWATPVEKYMNNVKAFDEIPAVEACSQPIRLFRPPYGRLTRKQIKALGDYRIIMWDVLSQDYDHGLSSEKCLRRTLAACRPGSIIVFHDSYKAQRNLEYVLPRLLDHFGGQGFGFRGIGI